MSVRSLLQRRAAFAGLVLSAGCSAALPRATVTDDIANATALASKVALRFDPEPVAVPHDSPTLPLATAVELAMHQDPRLQIALARVEQALADA